MVSRIAGATTEIAGENRAKDTRIAICRGAAIIRLAIGAITAMIMDASPRTRPFLATTPTIYLSKNRINGTIVRTIYRQTSQNPAGRGFLARSIARDLASFCDFSIFGASISRRAAIGPRFTRAFAAL